MPSIFKRATFIVLVLLSTSAFADEREAHVYLDVGSGGGVAGSSRTPLASIGVAPSVLGGAGLRYDFTNQFAVSVGLDVEVLLGAASPGAVVTIETASGRREVAGAIQSDTFIGTLPIRAEYALDLPVALFDFALADVYFAAIVGPSIGYAINNGLISPDDPALSLVGPGEIPPDIVFGGQMGLGVGGRVRAFDFISADIELRILAGFVGDLKMTGLVVVRPTFTFFPFAIF